VGGLLNLELLADGDYTLSVRIVLLNGKEQRIAQNWGAKIDTKAPKLQIDGIYDGIAYVDGEAFTGTVRDLDGQDLRANYKFTETTTPLTVSEGQVKGNIDMKNVPNFEERTITFEAEDRAGNISTLDYRAMKLPIEDLTEEGFGLQGMPIAGADSRSIPTGATGFSPTDATGRRIYIGLNGVWGFGSGSGSDSSWNASNPNGLSDPTIPTVDPALDLDQPLDYLTALSVILTTARDVLSNHKQTVAKKEALRRELGMLMAVGSVVEQKVLYRSMTGVLHGAFFNAFGNITRRSAISKGWDLAKNLAISIKPTGLQIFQANVFATSLAAMKENNQTIDEGDLLKATDSLAKTYARLNPIDVSFYSKNTFYSKDPKDRESSFLAHLFMDGKWATSDRDQQKSVPIDAEKNGVKVSFDYLVKEMQGQVDGVKSLELIDRTLQAATRVSQLHRDYYYTGHYEERNNAVTWISEYITSSIHESAFLSKLTDFGFEIARTNSEATELRGNQSSEWIETLVEGKNPGQWTGKHVNLAAAGMSEWFGGFSRPNTSPGYWSGGLRSDAKGALEYAERLVMAARAIDDVNLKPEVKKADLLSHLVNLGGAYAALNPTQDTRTEFFLDSILNGSVSAVSIQEMINFLVGTKMGASSNDFFSYLKRLAWSLKVDQFNLEKFTASEVSSIFSLAFDYYSGVQSGIQITSHEGIFEQIYYASSRQQARTTSQLIASSLLSENAPTYAVLSNQQITQSAEVIATSGPPSNAILDKIEARYRDLVQKGYSVNANEAADNLKRFLDGSGTPKYVSYTWLNSQAVVKRASGQVRDAYISRFKAIGERQSTTNAGNGSETQVFNDSVTKDYSTKNALFDLEFGFELAAASGAGNVQGVTKSIDISRKTKDSPFGKLSTASVSANIEYYWYDDYNWNAGSEARFDIPGLGTFYDAEANLLVKYRSAMPYELYSGWDQKLTVTTVVGKKKTPFSVAKPNQPIEFRKDRFLPTLHSAYEPRQINQAKVMGKY
jgi:hypothetical protein